MKGGADQSLLGFDAREMSVPPRTAWDPARRSTYLLRTDVERPLSVDPMVWPSVFPNGSDWRGPNNGLWDDLSRMRTSLSQLASGEHWTVAVSWVSEDGFSKPPGSGPYREPMTPQTISDEWRLLGFDVADAWCLSGLSNCGCEQSELAALRARWATGLNEHHLFTDLRSAFSFRELTGIRVPEHAPFFVYALYLVDNLAR